MNKEAQLGIQNNTNRIQTTHIGSLPRPHDLLDIMKAKLNHQPYDEGAYRAKLSKAVAGAETGDEALANAQKAIEEILAR